MTTLCQNKSLYYTAKHAVAVHRIRQPQVRERLYVYKCQVDTCPGYHITKLKPPEDDIISPSSLLTRKETRVRQFLETSKRYLRPQAGALPSAIE